VMVFWGVVKGSLVCCLGRIELCMDGRRADFVQKGRRDLGKALRLVYMIE
jgi:hypothetical protein